MVLWGTGLAIVGLGIIISYALYYFAKGFFVNPLVPLALKIAVPSVILGVIILLAAAARDRYRAKKDEHFEEVDR